MTDKQPPAFSGWYPVVPKESLDMHDKRKAFEASKIMAGSLFRRRDDAPDKYWDGNVQDDWELWQLALESKQVVSDEQLAHEIWAAAQMSPTDFISDAVERITALLALKPQQAAQSLPVPSDADLDMMDKWVRKHSYNAGFFPADASTLAGFVVCCVAELRKFRAATQQTAQGQVLLGPIEELESMLSASPKPPEQAHIGQPPEMLKVGAHVGNAPQMHPLRTDSATQAHPILQCPQCGLAIIANEGKGQALQAVQHYLLYIKWLRAAYLYYVDPNGHDTGMSDYEWDEVGRKLYSMRNELTADKFPVLHDTRFSGGSIFWLQRKDYPKEVC